MYFESKFGFRIFPRLNVLPTLGENVYIQLYSS